MDYFVIEESSWAWDGEDRLSYIRRIDQFLERLDIARQRGEGYLASREWLEQTIVGGLSLGELLFQIDETPLSLPREIREEIIVCIGRMRCWDDEHPMNDFEATFMGDSRISPGAAFVHRRLNEGALLACLALPGSATGRVVVEVRGETLLMFFVTDEPSHREFFRMAAVEAKVDTTTVATLAAHAYPDTHFIEGIWRDVRGFVGGYDAVRESLLSFLAVYDDHGHWIFTDDTGRLTPWERVGESIPKVPLTQGLIERRFAGLGFDVAPENPDVRRNSDCRRARERTVEGETIYCEWHLKLMRHQNRVHIHGPIDATDGRVIVAIFCDHLPLP